MSITDFHFFFIACHDYVLISSRFLSIKIAQGLIAMDVLMIRLFSVSISDGRLPASVHTTFNQN